VITNFEVFDTVKIVTESGIFDLHNDFSFTRMLWEPQARALGLEFWSDDVHGTLSFTFQAVSLLKVRQRDNAYPDSEGATVRFIGFVHPEQVEEMDAYVPNRVEATYPLLICFQDRSAVKVFAHSANANIR
jgi:hypothetical protein